MLKLYVLKDRYLVVDAVQVGVEALVIPPASMRDFSTDVSCVWGAEALFIMVPAERVFHCSTEARHMEPVLG